jgi:DNA-binding PadR family transcriptional regulator
MRDTTADRWFHGPWDGVQMGAAAAALLMGGGPGTPPGTRGRHRRRAGSPPEPGPRLGFGLGGPGGFFAQFPFGRGPKARRGDVRAAALVLLAEAPRNGYQLMQEIENRSGGVWRPSPGSIYPVLQQLEDEGLVRPQGPDGRRQFELTDVGRQYVEEHGDELGTPWSTVADSMDAGLFDLRGLIAQVHMAAIQVMRAGSDRQVKDAQEVLIDTRRRLYRILAEDEPADGDDLDEHGGRR